MTLKENAKKLKQNIPAVFLALKDQDTPIAAKLVAAVTVAYALSPIDLMPDFIPVLGYLDDLILLPALTALTIKLIPREVWGAKPEMCGKYVGRWETQKMVLCSPHLDCLDFCCSASS